MNEDRLEALSERLLELHEMLDFYGHDTDEYDIDAIEEAESLIQSQAKELETLRADNARLREVVEPFVTFFERLMGDDCSKKEGEVFLHFDGAKLMYDDFIAAQQAHKAGEAL